MACRQKCGRAVARSSARSAPFVLFLARRGRYARLAAAVASIPRGDLVDDAASCRALVQSLPVQRRLPAKSLNGLETTLSGPA